MVTVCGGYLLLLEVRVRSVVGVFITKNYYYYYSTDRM